MNLHFSKFLYHSDLWLPKFIYVEKNVTRGILCFCITWWKNGGSQLRMQCRRFKFQLIENRRVEKLSSHKVLISVYFLLHRACVDFTVVLGQYNSSKHYRTNHGGCKIVLNSWLRTTLSANHLVLRLSHYPPKQIIGDLVFCSSRGRLLFQMEYFWCIVLQLVVKTKRWKVALMAEKTRPGNKNSRAGTMHWRILPWSIVAEKCFSGMWFLDEPYTECCTDVLTF